MPSTSIDATTLGPSVLDPTLAAWGSPEGQWNALGQREAAKLKPHAGL